MAKAVDRLTKPPHERERALDFNLDKFKLTTPDSSRLMMDITESITDATCVMTIEGASTVTINVEDTHGKVLTSPVLTQWVWGKSPSGDEKAWIRKGRHVDATLDGLPFRLVRVSKVGTSLTLTFEERAVSQLRERKGARHRNRDTTTRAEFIGLLASEIKGLAYYAPELHKRQPISKSSELLSGSERSATGSPGIVKGGGITVKGARATTEQRRNMEIVLDVARSHNAPTKAALALIEACIVESGFRNLTHGDADSLGILQARVSIHGRKLATDVAASAAKFLTSGFAGVGAIELARSSPGLSSGDIAARVQMPAAQYRGRYAQVQPEAMKILRAYMGAADEQAGLGDGGDVSGTAGLGSNGGVGTLGIGTGVEALLGGSGIGGEAGVGFNQPRTQTRAQKKYRFQRGPTETSWDAMGRLADEVGWRRFMRDGRLWYISEEDLFAQKPALVISEESESVDWIDFDLDLFSRIPVAELHVGAYAQRWTALPGMVVLVRNSGLANGRWLVTEVTRSLLDRSGACQITLKKAIQERDEPAAAEGLPQEMDGTTSRKVRRRGARGIVDSAFEIAQEVGGPTVYVGSDLRPGSTTTSGNPSDHAANDASRAARDIGVKGVNLLTGPPSPHLDKAAAAIGKAFGRDYGNGAREIIDTFQWHGYRVQIIWRTPAYGGHMGHIHIGARKE